MDKHETVEVVITKTAVKKKGVQLKSICTQQVGMLTARNRFLKTYLDDNPWGTRAGFVTEENITTQHLGAKRAAQKVYKGARYNTQTGEQKRKEEVWHIRLRQATMFLANNWKCFGIVFDVWLEW